MLILASASPRRSELLRRITDEFVVRPTSCDEHLACADPAAHARALALRKAQAAEAEAGDTVLAADTLVALDGVIYEKPRDEQDARRMLRALSGRTHTVYTGVALRRGAEGCDFVCATRVTFWELEDELLERYVRSGEPMDKAGSYGIQGLGALLVRHIEGDFFNVMGLPVAQVYRALRALGAL